MTAAAAAYLGAGSWLAALCSPGATAGVLSVGAGAAVLVRTAGSILLREPRVCPPADRVTLVLSCAAAVATGAWVLLIGLMYYAFAAAGRLRPTLQKALPASPLRKAIGALQPLALLLALTPGIPSVAGTTALLGALALLLVSFGRDAAALERLHRSDRDAAETAGAFNS